MQIHIKKMNKFCLCILLVLLLTSCGQAIIPQTTPKDNPAIPPDIFDLKFSDLVNLEFLFASGAGGWCTTVRILPDGTFSGYYYDSDMGDNDTNYPNGTSYEGHFSGRFSSLKKTGDYEYSMKCDLLTTEGTIGEEKIIDGVRVITSGSYGINDADEFLLYLPGKKVDELPKEFLIWVGSPRVFDYKNADVLNFYGLYNVNGKLGFYAEKE